MAKSKDSTGFLSSFPIRYFKSSVERSNLKGYFYAFIRSCLCRFYLFVPFYHRNPFYHILFPGKEGAYLCR